jgi:phosphoribosylaminoimidazole-succinocarboxamide synthase
VTPVGLPKLRSGKVRDVYQVGDDRLLMVASDRISAFDVILPEPIPDKGRVLTAVSAFWFDHTKEIVANHLISVDPADFPAEAGPDVAGRAMLVKAAQPVLMECVVRGYLFGSAWSEYQKHGTVNGEPLPSGMVNAERLPEPIFTPSTKADEGHDMALSQADAIALVGKDLYEQLRGLSIAIYKYGTTVASSRGILLADTKFEFGTVDGELVLIDEILTPDSSRFWPADEYEPGTAPPSFDKQYVRQYLLDQGWNGTPPPPSLPDEVVRGTRARYVEAYELLTGKSFDDWYGVGT